MNLTLKARSRRRSTVEGSECSWLNDCSKSVLQFAGWCGAALGPPPPLDPPPPPGPSLRAASASKRFREITCPALTTPSSAGPSGKAASHTRRLTSMKISDRSAQSREPSV